MTKDQPNHYSSFDPREYLHHFEDADMTEEQKIEYIELVWNMMSEFAAIGWGVHPVQQAMEARARDKKSEQDTIRSVVREFVESEDPAWLEPTDRKSKAE